MSMRAKRYAMAPDAAAEAASGGFTDRERADMQDGKKKK